MTQPREPGQRAGDERAFPPPNRLEPLPRRGLLAAAGYQVLSRRRPAGGAARPPFWGGLTALTAWPDFFLAGPVLGAPMAVMTLEELRRRGAEEIIFFGLAGGLAEGLELGDLLCPERGLSTEGSSLHYPAPLAPDRELRRRLMAAGREETLIKGGTIWSTDAPFRETAALIEAQKARGALAVDMETAALWAAAGFRGLRLAALLVVSDRLTADGHEFGWGRPRFRRSLNRAARLAWRAVAPERPAILNLTP